MKLREGSLKAIHDTGYTAQCAHEDQAGTRDPNYTPIIDGAGELPVVGGRGEINSSSQN